MGKSSMGKSTITAISFVGLKEGITHAVCNIDHGMVYRVTTNIPSGND